MYKIVVWIIYSTSLNDFLVTLPQTSPAALGMTTTPEFRSAFLAKTTRSGHHGGSRSTLLGAHGGSRSTRLSLPSTPRNILNCRVRLLDGRDFDVQLPVRDYLHIERIIQWRLRLKVFLVIIFPEMVTNTWILITSLTIKHSQYSGKSPINWHLTDEKILRKLKISN